MKDLEHVEDILPTTTLRQLKELRKKIKKAGNQPFALQIVEKRIKKLQDEHLKKANFHAQGKLIKFLQKVTAK